MKLWCLFVVFLIFTSSVSSIDLNYQNIPSINCFNAEHFSSILPSRYFMQQNRSSRSSIAKRSQRNANILYRHCRRSGQAPKFCLKYAIRMVFATGH